MPTDPESQKPLWANVVHTVDQVDQAEWDQLNTSAFTSHSWYRYGEAVMADSQPMYILIKRGDELIARATFWLVKNEPLPIRSKTIRNALQAYLSHRPLLICRSPLANLSGLTLPDQNFENCLELIVAAAKKELHAQKGSFLLFDFMDDGVTDWPIDFVPYQVSDPGTCLKIPWDSFEEYLGSRSKKDRQHYKRSVRQAEALGLELTRHSTVPDIDEAMPLIRNVEERHHAGANPWARDILIHLDKIRATWLEIRQQGILVGCGLLAEDNGTLLATTLGLAENAPYVYFMLVYATLQEAFTRGVKFLRMGSGAYDIKRRLGFELEQNNYAVIWLSTPALRKLIRK